MTSRQQSREGMTPTGQEQWASNTPSPEDRPEGIKTTNLCLRSLFVPSRTSRYSGESHTGRYPLREGHINHRAMDNASPDGPNTSEQEGPIEVESVCMRCYENVSRWRMKQFLRFVVSLKGTTTILTTSIPHFRDVVIMAFECPHCGARHTD